MSLNDVDAQIERPKVHKPKKQLVMIYLQDAEQNEIIGAANVLNQLFPKIQWVLTHQKMEVISKHELKTWMKECLKEE